MFTYHLVLYQYVVCAILAIVALPLFSRLLQSSANRRTKSIKLTPVFCCYLANWWMFMASGFVYDIYMLYAFNDTKATASIFVWGVAVQLTMMISPATVFFVVLERNLILIAPFKQQIVRWWLIRVEAVVLLVLYVSFLFELLAVTQDLNLQTTCRAFGCIMTRSGGSIHLSLKIVPSILNLINMTVFVLALRSLSRSGIQKRTNRLAAIVICLELVWNIIPLILTNVLILSMGMNVARLIGPYLQTLTTIDGFLSALIYSLTLRSSAKTPPQASDDNSFSGRGSRPNLLPLGAANSAASSVRLSQSPSGSRRKDSSSALL